MDGDSLAAAMLFLSGCGSRKARTFVIASNEWRLVNKTSDYAVIQNTDPRGMKGQHWCIWVCLSGRLEWFDSLGQQPEYYSMDMPYGNRTRITNKNTVQYQQNYSNACGYYCLYFFYHRIRNRSFDSIMNDFNPFNRSRNDRLVTNFYNSLSFCKFISKNKSSMCQISCPIFK